MAFQPNPSRKSLPRKLLQQLGRVYSTLKLDFLHKLLADLSELSHTAIERILIDGVAAKQLQLRINHAQRCIHFGAPPAACTTALDTQVATLGSQLNKVSQSVSLLLGQQALEDQKAAGRQAYLGKVLEASEEEEAAEKKRLANEAKAAKAAEEARLQREEEEEEEEEEARAPPKPAAYAPPSARAPQGKSAGGDRPASRGDFGDRGGDREWGRGGERGAPRASGGWGDRGGDRRDDRRDFDRRDGGRDGGDGWRGNSGVGFGGSSRGPPPRDQRDPRDGPRDREPPREGTGDWRRTSGGPAPSRGPPATNSRSGGGW